jgi:ATP/maltotriose-dependent transcriptional regulator MalT
MTPPISSKLSEALHAALKLEARRDYSSAAQLLDDALTKEPEAQPILRFQALMLRSEIAMAQNELGDARGILAEAKQIPLSPADRESLSTELDKADALEVFLTHRGCAG